MRLARPLALVFCAALAAPAFSAALPQYSQVRQAHPGIDDAVAAMPNSDFTSTANRLSELFNRKVIADATLGAGQRGELPENFLRNLDGTLADLASDLKEDDLASLSDVQVGYILRVIELYAFRRTAGLWQGNDFTYCPVITGCIPTPEHPCPVCIDNDPPVFDRLDAVIGQVQAVYTRARTNAGGVGPATLNGNNFPGAVGTLCGVLGVESIDD